MCSRLSRGNAVLDSRSPDAPATTLVKDLSADRLNPLSAIQAMCGTTTKAVASVLVGLAEFTFHEKRTFTITIAISAINELDYFETGESTILVY